MRIIKLLANYSPLIISLIIHLIVLIVYQFSTPNTSHNTNRPIFNRPHHQINFDLHSLHPGHNDVSVRKANQKHQEFPHSNPENITEKSNANGSLSEITSSNNSNSVTNTNELDAQFLSPEYPKMARLKNQEGNVLISVLFDDSGNSTSVKILESSRNVLLDEAAIKAAKHWKVPAHSIHELTKRIIFKLN